jgi:hypothetical protein
MNSANVPQSMLRASTSFSALGVVMLDRGLT